MNYSRLARFLGVVLIISLITLAPTYSTAATFPDTVFENTILIGASVSLSGDYEFEGQQALCGMKAAIDWVNSNGGIEFAGKKWFLKLVYEDDQSNPEKALKIYEDFLNNGINLFIAPYSESLANDVALLINREGGVLMLYGPSSDRLARQYQSTIQVSSPVYSKYSSLFKVLKEAGGSNVIVVIDSTAYAANSIKAIIRAANNEGLTVEGPITYTGPGSASKALSNLSGEYSMLLIVTDSLSHYKTILDEAVRSGVRFNIVATDIIVSFPHFYTELGSIKAEKTLGISEWEERDLYSKEMASQIPQADWYGPESTDEWVKYFSKYCTAGLPSSVAAAASAAVLALANYIYWAGSLNPDAIKAKASDVYMLSFYGPLRVDDRGYQLVHIPLVIQWIDGYKKIIYPEKYADAQLVYPAPNWAEAEGAGTTPGGGGEEAGGGPPITLIAAVIVLVVIVAGFMVMRSRG